MANNRAKPFRMVYHAVLVVAIVLFSGFLFSAPQPLNPVLAGTQPYIAPQSYSNWHAGTNQSTPLVTVTYAENYSTISQPINNTLTQMSLLQRFMWLQYNDNTGARVGFELHCVFYPGGINVSDQKVIDWSKLYNIELILHSETWEDNRTIGTMYSFRGFDIVQGNASNVSLVKISEGNGSFFYTVNNSIGSISYWTNYASIGNVFLSTGTSNESIAHFNISINATIGNGASQGYQSNITQDPISAVFSFTVTHNLTSTQYKYGANVDWSSAKSFPTAVPMKSGETYSLVAKDLLMFYVGGTNGEVKQFSTDAANDTAIYNWSNQTMCKELLTTSYYIDNGSVLHNTTRIYVADSSHDQFGNVSSVFVVFSGFSYGNSSSLSFDPAVITPNTLKTGTEAQSQLFIPILVIVITAAVAGGVVFIRIRKR